MGVRAAVRGHLSSPVLDGAAHSGVGVICRGGGGGGGAFHDGGRGLVGPGAVGAGPFGPGSEGEGEEEKGGEEGEMHLWCGRRDGGREWRR